MAARKKASRKGSVTITKKSKAPVASTTSRKHKASASASRAAAKAKAARGAKSKTTKTDAKARARAAASAAAKRRAAVKAEAAKAAVAKSAKAAETRAPHSEAATKAAAISKAAPEVLSREAAPPVAAKPIAAPLAKRPPLAGKPTAEVAEAAVVKPAKPATPRPGFKVNEFVVYPAHGVGQIVAVEDQEVAGFHLELFVINFAKDKMTLRVPTSKVAGVGMRKLSEPDAARKSLEILTGRARVKRTMWSRRAQEYEAKINSGDINAIAEVVRDLYRSEAQPEQSYSERQLYEAALDRIMREIAAVQKLNEIDALKLIETHLKKSQRRAAKADGVEGDEAAVEEAA